MKTIIFSLLPLFIAFSGISQTQAIMDFHNTYKDNGKYLSVKIDGGLLNMLSSVETNDEDTKDLLNAIKNIDAIDVHSVDRKETGFNESGIKKFKKEIRKEKYDELLVVREGDENVDFLIREKKGRISDLLLVVDEPGEFVIVNISGDIDLRTISRVTEGLDIKGAEHLEKIE